MKSMAVSVMAGWEEERHNRSWHVWQWALLHSHWSPEGEIMVSAEHDCKRMISPSRKFGAALK